MAKKDYLDALFGLADDIAAKDQSEKKTDPSEIEESCVLKNSIPVIDTPSENAMPKNDTLTTREVTRSIAEQPNNDIPIPKIVFASILPLLRPSEQVVYLQLYRISCEKSDSNVCEVGYRTLAKLGNITLNTVRKGVTALAHKGLIEIQPGGGDRANQYIVIPPEKLAVSST